MEPVPTSESSRPVERADARSLLATLAAQRRHVLAIVEGLDDVQLRRSTLPSGWSCAGLIRHLALDVERFWFRAVVGGETVALESGDSAWQVPADQPAAAVLDLYRNECALADEIIAATSLDAPATWWPGEVFPEMQPQALRDTILHVIVETARHAGHLDAARELIDGAQWLVLTDVDRTPGG